MIAPHSVARHRLSVDDFHRMAEAGILREDSRVELIEGELIDMSPIGILHSSVVNRLAQLLVHEVVQNLAIVSIQNPISLPRDSEPAAGCSASETTR